MAVHTRCVTIQEAVPVTLALQNHLPVLTHLTTAEGVCMPQYLSIKHQYCRGTNIVEELEFVCVCSLSASGTPAHTALLLTLVPSGRPVQVQVLHLEIYVCNQSRECNLRACPFWHFCLRLPWVLLKAIVKVELYKKTAWFQIDRKQQAKLQLEDNCLLRSLIIALFSCFTADVYQKPLLADYFPGKFVFAFQI